MTGAGPTTEQASLFETAPGMPDVLEPGNNYFDGFDLSELSAESRERWGLRDPDATQTTRHSYLYEVDYPTSSVKGESNFGKIELRGWTWTYSDDLPERYWQMVEAAAHRGAMMYDTSVEVPDYAGYLTGFSPENPSDTRSPSEAYESEEIEVNEAKALGAVVWSVEIYDDDGRLRGVAQGTAYPWLVVEETTAGREEVSVAPHKWGISYNESRDAYDLHPTGRTNARKRYRPGGAAADKTVYLNGHPIGEPDSEGRRLLKNEYQGGPTYRGKWSRRGIIEDDEDATAAAIRDGGTLYLTGETEDAIYLATTRAKPDGYQAADPDDVSPSLKVQDGTTGETRLVLGIRDREDAIPVECRRDETQTDVYGALGKSTPIYRHTMPAGWFA